MIDTDDPIELLVKRIIGAAIKVHIALGPGFLESAYENALKIQLERDGLNVAKEHIVVLTYLGEEVGRQRVDLMVEGCVIIELKTVRKFEEVHFSVVKSYMKATGCHAGLLLNFASPVLDVKRVYIQSHEANSGRW